MATFSAIYHNVFFIGGNKMSQNKTQHSEESAKTFTDEH